MIERLEGRARRFGDDINTDYIIASTRKRDTLDGDVLKRYLLETVDPAFAATVEPGDVIVAGRNFGCGSAMEVAATVILAAGIRAVLAETISRTFYRNAINNGLLPVQCDTSAIHEGDALMIAVTSDRGERSPRSAAGRTRGGGAPRATKEDDIVVTIARTGQTITGAPLPAIMLDILNSGGLVPYVRAGGLSAGASFGSQRR